MIDLSDGERAQLVADLTAARDELLRRGRCKGAPLDFGDSEKVCAIGSVIAAVAPSELTHDTFTFVACGIPRALAAAKALSEHVPAELTYETALANLGGLA